MKNLILPLLLVLSPGSFAGQSLSKPAAEIDLSNANIVYNAVTDFKLAKQSDAPFYIDKRNNALGIDARHIEYRNLFAKATTHFDGKSGGYDVTITTITEEDGESVYRLLVNGELVAIHKNPYVGEHSANDLQPAHHTWQAINLNKGDEIAIESAAHTNGEIPENGGTAWARGRWQQIAFTETSKMKVPRPTFNKRVDLLLAQFESKPTAGYLHTIAALGSMLKHEDLAGVNYLTVAGASSDQDSYYYTDNSLFDLAFGKENLKWIDARKDLQAATNKVSDRVKAVLAQGGKIWVQEAGPSNFTHDWLARLSDLGIHSSILKNNIIVVQHSALNEEKTTGNSLAYVKNNTYYQAISSGTKPKLVYVRKNRRGPVTPIYVDQDSKWLQAATDKLNTNEHSQSLWQEAVNLAKESEFFANQSDRSLGVDFSDAVANWWIFDLGQPAVSVHAFWRRYVTDLQLDFVNAPEGRLAVVIDGNSPDPDDIGATPVIFGLLNKTNLEDRLVHVSHSCDLDPFKNRGYQIKPADEQRRQNILHHLTGKSIELFGPFDNLRNFYNCRIDQAAAVQDLVDAINGSTQADPLWIIEAGEPDLIGYALQKSNPEVLKYVHVVSHHPANDNSGDYFTWQQILDFGVTEHQIGDQNVGLQTEMHEWDWAHDHESSEFTFIWQMLAYAEKDGVVPFQTNKFDCSDAGMVYWWITGADQGGNNFAGAKDIQEMLLGVKNNSDIE